MTNDELMALINELSDEKIQEIESIDNKQEGIVIVIGIANKVKRLRFTLNENGDFSYKFLGTRLRKL